MNVLLLHVLGPMVPQLVIVTVAMTVAALVAPELLAGLLLSERP